MGAFENRKLVYILGGLLLLIAAALGFSLTRGSGDGKEEEGREEETAAVEPKRPGQDACASNATYARLKEVAFEEAAKLRTPDQASLDTLAAASVVRMEDPVVRSRDEELNVTVCSGRLILELPPGSEAGFGGQRRLTTEIEYNAQAAADGSGLVYQMTGAEPLISKLAAFDMRGQRLEIPADAAQPQTEYAEAAPVAPAPRAAPERPEEPDSPPPPPAPKAAPKPPAEARLPARPPAPKAPQPRVEEREPVRTAAYSNPSFNCRSARTRGERAVCASRDLAARDRAMSSMFYSAMASADGRRRADLRRTRDRFLAYRDRCPDDSCIAEAYDGRMREIRDIMEAE